jgi:mannose-6-phosphate isomerase-like protein (cupin superfamily)
MPLEIHYGNGQHPEEKIMSHPSYHESLPEGIEVLRWPHSHPLPEKEIVAFFESRGLASTRWSNGPGEVYAAHTHTYQKTLFCVKGSITFSLPDLQQEIALHAGDRLIFPPATRHAATVGPEGVICIEAGEEPR